MSIKKEIVRDASAYVPTTYISLIVGVISGLIVRKFLDPSLMGDWVMLSTVLGYALFCHLGILDGAEREIPYCHGKGDYQKAEEVKNAAFTFCVIAAAITSAIFLISAISS